ncbi:MAG: hypothetical protein ABI602_03680 [Candidatus Saccharibacteria bacterium]
MMNTLDSWHKTRIGRVVFAAVEGMSAYGFGSLAVDRGNFLWYGLALVGLVGCLQNVVKLIGSFGHGRT